jgi:hypothetical protein
MFHVTGVRLRVCIVPFPKKGIIAGSHPDYIGSIFCVQQTNGARRHVIAQGEGWRRGSCSTWNIFPPSDALEAGPRLEGQVNAFRAHVPSGGKAAKVASILSDAAPFSQTSG